MQNSDRIIFFIVLPFALALIVSSYSVPAHAGTLYCSSIISSADTVQRISMMFEVRHGQQNSMDIKNHPYFRNSNNSYAFGIEAPMIQGMSLSDDGLLSWSPDADQFQEIKAQMKLVDFYAIDQDGNYVIGQIRLFAAGELIVQPQPVGSAVAQTEVLVITPTDTILQAILPTTKNWNRKSEGEVFNFQIGASGGSGDYKFQLLTPAFLHESLDARGNFSWIPDHDLVSPVEKVKTIQLEVKVLDTGGESVTEIISLTIEHVNRPPMVNELPICYIQYNHENSYHLKKAGIIDDPDGDSLVFKPVLQELPQGMTIESNGELRWRPATRQFNYLRSNPMFLSFTVEDYPAGTKTIGQLRIEVSQADLPPQITIVPKKDDFEIKEDEALKLSFFITDPNGEEDIHSFGFISENSSIHEESLTKKETGQYEFAWTPGFDFIKETGKKEEFEINFFAIDKEGNRAEKNIFVAVIDTENQLEKDRVLYDQYRTVLERAWDLITQLNEKEKELDKAYSKAKNGKKNRAISTAGLGALTGLSPIVFMENPQGQKITAGIGGTCTATIGTLEASNVIGESPSDIMRDLSYVSQKRNDLLIYGNVFASRYALPVNRREAGFPSDLRSLSINLSINDSAKLDLDATWENSKNATSKNIKKVFKDFNPDERFEGNYEQ